MSKGGIARAAQALAPRVAWSFSEKIGYIPSIFEIHYSIFVIRFFTVSFSIFQTGSSADICVLPANMNLRSRITIPGFLPEIWHSVRSAFKGRCTGQRVMPRWEDLMKFMKFITSGKWSTSAKARSMASLSVIPIRKNIRYTFFKALTVASGNP